MHSRIFQIESDTVDVEDRISKDTIPEWFTNSIADYVEDIRGNREDEIEWLMSTNFGKVCKRNGDEITFNIDVSAFFEQSFEQFKSVVEDLSKITFNEFAGGHRPGATYDESISHLMYMLREAFDDEFEFYVWNDDELYTMSSWMRQVEPCGVYYIGGIVDYHF